MPDSADVAGPSHHDYTGADGGDYGADYGAPDVTGDYVGGDVGFTGTLSADQVSSLQENISGLDKLGNKALEFFNPKKNFQEYAISAFFSTVKNVGSLIIEKKRSNKKLTGKDINKCVLKTVRDFGALYLVNQAADSFFDAKISDWNNKNNLEPRLRLERAIGNAEANSNVNGAFGMFLDVLNKRKDEFPIDVANPIEARKNVTKLLSSGILATLGMFLD